LKGTTGKGILMKNNNSNDVCGYSDTDWVESFDQKSTTDFYTFVGGNLVTWRNKKQNVMARSGVEAEYRAMTSTVSELTWIKQLLADMSITIHKPMKIFCDNQAARHIASNPVFHERMKHIEVDCYFVREKVQVGKIKTPFVRSQDQLADIFTKGLEPRPFEENTRKLELIDIYNPNLRRSVRNYS
jgi:hypothetical protein